MIQQNRNEKIVVALIDTGLSSQYTFDNLSITGTFNLSDEPTLYDLHGHATGIAGMIDQFIGKKIELIIIKVLNASCSCTSETLMKAVDLAIELRPDIINLSLGTENAHLRSTFENRLKKAEEMDIILLTTNNGDKSVFPFSLKRAVKVVQNFENPQFENLFYSANDSTFYTPGIPHVVPWVDGKYVFINQNSFVTPYWIKEFVNMKYDCSLTNYEVLRQMQYELSDKIVSKEHVIEEAADLSLYKYVVKIFKRYIHSLTEKESTFEQGMDLKKCLKIIDTIAYEVNGEIPFTYFNANDFNYVSNFTNKLNLLMKQV